MLRGAPRNSPSASRVSGTTTCGIGNAPATRRTDRDMSMRVVIFGSLGLIALLAIFLAQDVPWFGAILGAMYPATVNQQWYAVVEDVNNHDLSAVATELAALRHRARG